MNGEFVNENPISLARGRYMDVFPDGDYLVYTGNPRESDITGTYFARETGRGGNRITARRVLENHSSRSILPARGTAERGASDRDGQSSAGSRIIQLDPIHIEGRVPREGVPDRALRSPSPERMREERRREIRYQELQAIGPSVEELEQQELRATVERGIEREELMRSILAPLQVEVPRPVRARAEFGEAVGIEHLIEAADIIEAIVPIIPIVGDIIDAVEATTDRSWLLQRQLTDEERAWAAGGLGISLLIPFAGRLRRAVNSREIIAGIASRLGSSAQTITDLFRGLERLAPIRSTIQNALERVAQRARLSDQHIDALRRLRNQLRQVPIYTFTGVGGLGGTFRRAGRIVLSPRLQAAVQAPRLTRAAQLVHETFRLGRLRGSNQIAEAFRRSRPDIVQRLKERLMRARAIAGAEARHFRGSNLASAAVLVENEILILHQVNNNSLHSEGWIIGLAGQLRLERRTTNVQILALLTERAPCNACRSQIRDAARQLGDMAVFHLVPYGESAETAENLSLVYKGLKSIR